VLVVLNRPVKEFSQERVEDVSSQVLGPSPRLDGLHTEEAQ